MTQSYLIFTILLVFVVLNAAILIGLSHLVAPRQPTTLKGSPYESGMPPLGSARERFSVKLYLVAMLFIVFDIETVFLVPWATIYFGSGAGTGEGWPVQSSSNALLSRSSFTRRARTRSRAGARRSQGAQCRDGGSL